MQSNLKEVNKQLKIFLTIFEENSIQEIHNLLTKSETNNKPEKKEISPKKIDQDLNFKRLGKQEKDVVDGKDKNKISQLTRSTTDKISTNFLLPFSELLHDNSLNKKNKEEKQKEQEKDFKEELKKIANKNFENNSEIDDHKDGKSIY